MKRTKKIVSILLTLVMALAMSIPAFAEGDEGGVTPSQGSLTGGSITIDDAVVGQTYSAYQILYLESYNATAGAYSYKANSAWETWLKTQTTYVSFDAQGYVTWVEGADAAAFAKLAQVEAAKMTADATATATTTEVKFENLKLGYYLVDTTLGTICSLDTTNPSVTIKEKNAVPTIEKKVKEDSTSEFVSKNTAQIGQTVEFQTTIKAYKGAQNYVVHDVMSEGLTFDSNSILIKEIGKEGNLNSNTDYTVIVNSDESTLITDGCTFEIKFSESYLDSITGTENSPTQIIITYTAVLNDKAVISTNVNTNKTKLNYGDIIDGNYTGETEPVGTKTYTYKFDLVKTDSSSKLLADAEFSLYKQDTVNSDKVLVKLIKVSDTSYRIATQEEINANNEKLVEKIVTVDTGKICIEGIDSDSVQKYWLKEIKAPGGYNIISDDIEVDVSNGNNTATMTGDNNDTWSAGGVHIINNTGTELPSTGGIGTTVFYAAGVILALGAAVALVARRRMRTE